MLNTSEGITCFDAAIVDAGGEPSSKHSIKGLRELFHRPLMLICRTEEERVNFIQAVKEEAFDAPEVEARIRIDAFAHYADHTEGIQKWLEGTQSG